MEIITQSYCTLNGLVEGIQVKWSGGHILFATGTKGILACGVFDLAALNAFGSPAAIVESTPENPIGNLQRFPRRKIAKVNAKAASLGIAVGMDVTKALEIIA